MLTLPLALLGDDPAVAAGYRSRWTDVFVDEYQDVDEQQYRLLRLLTAPDSRVCAIGDPDQAIYGFRGGDVGYFLRFQSDFDSAVTVQLSRSYRSAPTIVRAAMQLIRPGTLVPGRELVPARSDIPDGPVALRAVSDEREEAEAVAAEIEKLLGGASFHALDSRAVDGRESGGTPALLRRLRRPLPDVGAGRRGGRGPGQARVPVPAAVARTAGRDGGRPADSGGARRPRHAGRRRADADGLGARVIESDLAGSTAASTSARPRWRSC